MQIFRISIENFRGFKKMSVDPRGHVVVVGEPGAGRSDVSEAIRRVLDPDSTRQPLLDDLDFHGRDKESRIDVEAVIGELSKDQEQRFVDHLELWDATERRVVESLKDPSAMDEDRYSFVLRLCYRAQWDDEQEQAEHWVDYPKTSDTSTGEFDRVRRIDREAIPFLSISTEPRPLGLAQRSQFRRVVDSQPGQDFGSTVEDVRKKMDSLAATVTDSQQVAAALDRVLGPIRDLLRVGSSSAVNLVKFTTDGGSLSGLIRGLTASLDRGGAIKHFPVERHGSTVRQTFAIAQAMAMMEIGDAIIVADDFGDGVDALSAQHLAATLRVRAGQVWITTRNPQVCEAFAAEELVRLAAKDGDRFIFQGKIPIEKAERSAHKHFSLQLLPAMSARAVVVVEGPHDRTSLGAVASRLNREKGNPLLSAFGLCVVDAGANPDGGGITAIPRLSRLAKNLGFFVVALIDWDHKQDAAASGLSENLTAADCVVRLPKGIAIELAILDGLEDSTVIDTMKIIQEAYKAHLPPDLDQLSGDKLRKAASKVLKTSPGLHSQFIDALPPTVIPELMARLVTVLREVVEKKSTGHVQL